MDKYACVVFLVAVIGVVAGFPASKDEVEYVPLEHQRPGQRPSFDFDYADRYFPNPFGPVTAGASGFSDHFDSLLERMRQQIAALFHDLPTRADFPETSDGFPGGFPVPSDLGKGNTTSVTKVIDGHKVVINETDYKTEGSNGGAYFKVRIIDIKPTESDVEGPSTVNVVPETRDREVEPLEDSIENEIPKNKEGSIYDNVETFDDIDYRVRPKESELDWTDVEPLETFDDNALGFKNQQQYHDLSNDIYVNQLLADAGAPTNPDAEFVPEYERRPRSADVKRRIR